jgi:hypothetical protein
MGKRDTMKKRTVHANRKAGETVHDVQTVLDAVRGEGEWAKDSDKSVTTSFGNLTAIGKRLGVHRNTVLGYSQRWKTVADAIEQEKELRKDFVEDKMLKRVMEGSDTMIIFFAKTQMKDRGYVERQEITGAEGGPIRVKGYAVFSPDDWENDKD